jgi:hypothetical protein
MRAETKFNCCHWTLMLTQWERGNPWLLISNHLQQNSQHSNTPKLKVSAARSTSLPVPSLQNLQPKKGLASEGKAPPQPKVL